MEKHFSPYKIIKHSPLGLWLELPTWRRWLGIIAWRLIPVFILSLLTFLLITGINNFPNLILAGLLIIGLVAIYMFTVKIICAVTLTSAFIEVSSFGIWGVHQTKYFISGVQWIDVQISDHIRGGAIFYNLVLKNNKKVQFMHQPTLTTNQENMEHVIATLKSITSLDAKVIGRFTSRT